MDPKSSTATKPAEREVLITREFDAPRKLVFNAWSDPEHLMRWYAPRGCTVEVRKLDFRTGGLFHYCIRNPEFGDCWCKGVYREIVVPERIVFTLGFADEEGNDATSPPFKAHADWPRETIVTVTFADVQGKTKLTLHQTVSESLARRTGALPSWIEMLERLAENLALPSGGNRCT